MIGPWNALSASRIDRGVGEGGRIDDDSGRALAAAMNPFDDLVLAIALMELDLEPELGPDAPAIRLDIGQRLAAVNLRLAFSQEVEIGTVQDGDDRAQGRFRNGAAGAVPGA